MASWYENVNHVAVPMSPSRAGAADAGDDAALAMFPRKRSPPSKLQPVGGAGSGGTLSQEATERVRVGLLRSLVSRGMVVTPHPSRLEQVHQTIQFTGSTVSQMRSISCPGVLVRQGRTEAGE